MDNHTFYQYLIQKIVMPTGLWTCLHISFCEQKSDVCFQMFLFVSALAQVFLNYQVLLVFLRWVYFVWCMFKKLKLSFQEWTQQVQEMLNTKKFGDIAFRDKDFKTAIDYYSKVSTSLFSIHA